MVYRVYMLASKKPDVSLEEFKSHWDNEHLNLLKEIGGDAYPKVHAHRYPAQVLGPEGAGFDGIGYLEFEKKEDFLRLTTILGKPENQARVNEDEKKFLDMSKFQMYVVDDEV